MSPPCLLFFSFSFFFFRSRLPVPRRLSNSRTCRPDCLPFVTALFITFARRRKPSVSVVLLWQLATVEVCCHPLCFSPSLFLFLPETTHMLTSPRRLNSASAGRRPLQPPDQIPPTSPGRSGPVVEVAHRRGPTDLLYQRMESVYHRCEIHPSPFPVSESALGQARD